MRVDSAWQNSIFYALQITWVGGAVLLYLRHLKRERAYLRHFPPVDGVPLDALRGGNPFGARSRAAFRVMLRRQPEPELERMRRDLWRRWRYVLLWIYGFPVGVIGVIVGVAVLVHLVRAMRLLP